MTDRLDIAIAQLNPIVGDLSGNLASARRARAEAAAAGADLVVYSELFLAGYPPEDLVLKPAFQAEVEAAVQALAADTDDDGPAVLIGAPWRENDALYNSVLLLAEGEIVAVRHKRDLPNYGVFDEKRVFAAGVVSEPIAFRTAAGALVRLGVMICEDMWNPAIAESLIEAGAEFLVVVNGSPFEDEKHATRLVHATARVRETGVALLYVNQVGGQDELVFDGASFVLNRDSSYAVALPAWTEAVVVTHWTYGPHDGWRCAVGERAAPVEPEEAIYRTLMLGLHDYVTKNHFPGVILGMSGGIDSALTAAIAVDALGPHRVRSVMMPSRYTSAESLTDGAEVARMLGIRYDITGIAPGVAAFDAMLEDLFVDTVPNEAEENIQARIRGTLLMALSNKFGHLLLTTGNKSEVSVGYSTLYGDMAGGYSVLKDVYKTDVFALAEWRNRHRPQGFHGPEGRVMPQNVITKPPSAELRANQTDQDSLPPYDVLDAILQGLIEDELSVGDIVAQGHALDVVARVEKLLYLAEYKRRQAPPGVKITRRNFGRDRRYPITNRYRTTG